jgi:hypothetical protein
MSDAQTPRHDPGQHTSSGCWAALAIVFGVILLLPGGCAILLIAMGAHAPIVEAGLLALFVGVALIIGGIANLATRRSRLNSTTPPKADAPLETAAKARPEEASRLTGTPPAGESP